jgi:hypothetical protein
MSLDDWATVAKSVLEAPEEGRYGALCPEMVALWTR